MGVITAENNLSFKSSEPMFARIKKRLSSYDAMGLIDDGDFHFYVKQVLEGLGQAVYKECEAVLEIKDFQAKLPKNFAIFHSAYRCSFNWQGRAAKSINEQRPWIYYHDMEISVDCPSDCCVIDCCEDNKREKVVIRTYVNGDEGSCGTAYQPTLLKLSPNVKDLCTEDCPNLFCPGLDEITIEGDEKKIVRTTFDGDSIYMQYYGLPMDKYGLPMIPDQSHIEKAIEYYIYTQLFEEFYWNSTVPNVGTLLADARQQHGDHMGMAVSWVKLPSFKRMVASIRRQRNNRKFFQFGFDRTRIN